ncbi:uncharacterized protein LOC124173552 [Ischnura elegans]|uniref:uncharacterized protein LOC124173552 n=1 Tax=Ischnura elegans TaxID=197161 RepID=UPI001ED899A4|nr:uncharacterized protein LOC124173552 [Ischnura elegans]
MGYVLAAILIISTVFSGDLCRSHSFLGPEFCSEGLEGPQPIVWSRPCRWYVDCVRNDDGSLTAYHERCPRGLLFDPVSKTCTAAAVGSGRVIPRRKVKRAAYPECNGRTFSCDITCKRITICADLGDGLRYFAESPCGGSTPYCNNTETSASCVSQIPEGCDSGFVCTAEGTFPDPESCSVYHYCYPDGGRLKDAMGFCDPGYVFSSDLDGCKLVTSAYDCHVATCPSGAIGYFAFPSEPRFYVMCIAGAANLVFRCAEGKEFSADGKCEAVCKKGGRFPNPVAPNCKGYIECLPTTSDGPPYKRYEKACPGSQTFNPFIRKCTNALCPTSATTTTTTIVTKPPRDILFIPIKP